MDRRGRRRGQKRKPQLPQGTFEAHIESLTHDGRGVARLDGKAIFIEGALPGELVAFNYTATQRKFAEGLATSVLQESDDRVEPHCSSYGLCGGCSLQHLDAQKQVEYKQKAMLDGLAHIGKVVPGQVLEPLKSEVWGYRRKSRLGVRYVEKQSQVLLGFREKRNRFITHVEACPVLHPDVGEQLGVLSEFIAGLDARALIPQIEVAVTDDATALVFRHMKPLSEHDKEAFRKFAIEGRYQVFLQPGGYDSVHPVLTSYSPLRYQHHDAGLFVEFHPLDFTQVNDGINQKMVKSALEFLQLDAEDEVLDLFCGLGNFTLPIAQKVKRVTGVEGDASMLERARENAEKNGILNTEYHVANLMASLDGASWVSQKFDKVLLDPPRAGAIEVLPYVAAMKPSIIVYISCHPGTLARDAGELVNTYGYRLTHAGVMDMFPHTAHVETMAVFEKN